MAALPTRGPLTPHGKPPVKDLGFQDFFVFNSQLRKEKRREEEQKYIEICTNESIASFQAILSIIYPKIQIKILSCEIKKKQDKVNNANSGIIFLINHLSVRIDRVAQLVRVVQVVQVSRWSAFMICIQKIVLFVVSPCLLFVVVCLVFEVVCRLSLFVVVCRFLFLFIVCRCLSLIASHCCHLSS